MVKRVAVLAALGAALALSGCSGNAEAPVKKGPAATDFPADFLFGTASSAYQVEGTYVPGGGRVTSNWSEWEDAGKITGGQKSGRAADFYERYDEDFARAEQLGTKAYRLGIEWARVETSPGVFDAAALKHYRDVLQAAHAHGLTPFVTLYHWVVPTWVQSPASGADLIAQAPTLDANGRLNSALSDALLPFVERAAKEYGDLVDYWVVLNEPWSVEVAGYWVALHPPGKLLDFAASRNAGLNFAITHAAAYDRIHAFDTSDADGDGESALVSSTMVGSNAKPVDPADPDGAAAAARYSYFTNDWLMNAWSSGALDVNFDGDIGDTGDVVPEGVYPQLASHLDYVAFNYYAPTYVTSCAKLANTVTGESKPLIANLAALPMSRAPAELPHSDKGQEIDPASFRTTLELFDRYTQGRQLPIFILENGLGDCADAQRARYLAEHLDVIRKAIDGGLPIRGYMVWSLTDNFEWTDGTTQCFGLYRVDYTADLARSETSAVSLYRQIATSRAIDAELFASTTATRYPTDCRHDDPAQKQQCLDAQPPVDGSVDSLIRSLCQ